MTRAAPHGWTDDGRPLWASRRRHRDAVKTVFCEWRGPPGDWDSFDGNRTDRPSGPAPEASAVTKKLNGARRRGARVHLVRPRAQAGTPRLPRRSCAPHDHSNGRRASQRWRVNQLDRSAGCAPPRPLERRVSRPNLTAGAVQTRAHGSTHWPPLGRHHRRHRLAMPPKLRLPMRSTVTTRFDQRRLRWIAMERQSTPPRTNVRRQSHGRRVDTIAPSRGSLFEHLPQAHGWVCLREAVSPWLATTG